MKPLRQLLDDAGFALMGAAGIVAFAYVAAMLLAELTRGTT